MVKNVFISCVKSKKKERCKARELYISPLFKMQLEYAKKITNPKDNIFILSAKYGVLELDDIIHPYELTLNNMNKKKQKEWAYKCYKQLQKKNINFDDEAIFLTGSNYHKYLQQLFKNNSIPLSNLSMGMRLQKLKEWLNE